MIAIVQVDGDDERYVEDVACVVMEWPDSARICREGRPEDEVVKITLGTTVSVVP